MTITLADLAFLQSPHGEQLLANLSHEDLSQNSLLSLVTKLREHYPQEEIHAAVTMAKLRQKAQEKFGTLASQLFFTDSALQQASDPYIRQYRAQSVNGLRILDVCCGIGTDSIAFARAGAIVHGLDYDETRIAIARHNAQILGLDIQFDIYDVTQGLPHHDYDLIFFDPARRDETGKRIYDVAQYIPPLSLINTWHNIPCMVKISPGVDLDQLQAYSATIEFISVNGDLKEAVLHTPQQPTRGLLATRITQSGIIHWQNDNEAVSVAIEEPTGWLCEPDPSILRANLVQPVADTLGGTQIDETIAYFCTPEKPASEWVRCWKIRDWLPFNLKKLRARLREMDIGILTVKKRGSPITPEDLIKKLKLKGSQSATVVLTRYQEQPIAIICDDIDVR